MKDCPDLTVMSADEKLEFWQKTDPRTLKRLADRLLAESLPQVEAARPREELSQEVAEQRAELGWSVEELSECLGVTTELYLAWEDDRVKPPESLPLIIRRLREGAIE